MCSIYAKWCLFDEVLADPINKSPQIQDNLPQEHHDLLAAQYSQQMHLKHAIIRSDVWWGGWWRTYIYSNW